MVRFFAEARFLLRLGSCKNITPIFSKIAQYSPSLLFAKVNTEQIQQLASDANIPVILHQGKEINCISAGLNESQMKQWIMECVQKLSL